MSENRLKRVPYEMNQILFQTDGWCKEHDCRIITIKIEGQSAEPKPICLEYKCEDDLKKMLELILKELGE